MSCGYRPHVLWLAVAATLLSLPALARTTSQPPVASHGKLCADLFMAIGRRDLPAVEALLKKGADPNSRNGLEFTPLFIAAGSGQVPVMEALLRAGARIDATSLYGTALTFAAQSGDGPAMRYLLSRDVDVNPSRADRITVLMLAARAAPPDTISELLRRKAEVNARDNEDSTALTYAARDGRDDVARLLLDAGAAVDAADRRGWTPLMYAAVNGHPRSAQLLLERGASPNARDRAGSTPLLLAAKYGEDADVIRALLKAGADPHAADRRKRTAYALASARGHEACARLLAECPTGKPAGAGQQPSPREAVRLSLKLIQRSMLDFNRRTGCVSCHQDGLGRMATGAAQARGFQLDPAVEKAELARINGGVGALRPLHQKALQDPEAMKQIPLIEISAIPPSYTWLLAGMAAHKQPANEATAATAMVLAWQQIPDGHWEFGLPRTPMQSSLHTVTAMAVNSIRTYGPRARAGEISERIEKARRWLLATPARTGEDRTFRLLGLKWAGASDEEVRAAALELKAAQRSDGGWAQDAGLKSDAYATGQALYALRRAGGLSVSDPAYQRGVAFLLRTQDDDGSWFVNKRAVPANNYFDASFPHGQSQYSSFNGTCWATLALLQTLDSPSGTVLGANR